MTVERKLRLKALAAVHREYRWDAWHDV